MKIFVINVNQITFHMNTYATLGCTVSTFDISITYFTGESYIRNTRLVSILIGHLIMKIVTAVNVSCWGVL